MRLRHFWIFSLRCRGYGNSWQWLTPALARRANGDRP